MAIPALLRHATGMRLENIMVDVLHTVDLGICSDIVGNILYIMVVLSACLGGHTYAERIKNMASHLAQWYKDTKTSYRLRGEVKMETIRQDGWPRLTAKAAAARDLSKYALYLLLNYGDKLLQGKPWADAELMTSLCRLLVRFYELIAIGDPFLCGGDRAELSSIGQYVADIYTRLGRYAMDDSMKLWKVMPKLHLWLHLTQQQNLMNPRQFWTYSDEDLVGQMIDIASTLHPKNLAYNTIFKWLHRHFESDE